MPLIDNLCGNNKLEAKEYGNKNKSNNANNRSNENTNIYKKLFLETMCSRPFSRHSKAWNTYSKVENKEVFNMFKYLNAHSHRNNNMIY